MSEAHISQHSAASNDLTTITINLQKLHNLQPHYALSEFTIKVEFAGQALLETPKKLFCKPIVVEESIQVPFDPENYEDFDKILSNPLNLTITEYEAHVGDDIEIVESGKAQWRSPESAMDLKEALFEDEKNEDVKKINKKSRKSSGVKEKKTNDDVASKSSKTSKVSKQTTKSKASKLVEVIVATKVIGMAAVDLISLLEGETLIKESFILNVEPTEILDDRLKSVANLPRVDLEISLNKSIPPGGIFNVCLESIYNLPQVLSPTMKYQINLEVPITRRQKINFDHYTYQDGAKLKFQRKKWFGYYNDYTEYYLEDDYENVSSKFEKPFNEMLQKDHPRVEYNVIKRIYLSEEDIDDLKLHIVKYKCLPLEIYITKEQARKTVVSLDSKPKKTSKDNESKATSKLSKTKQKISNEEPSESDCLHLMAYIDVSKLLHPGQQRQRVASQLRTFNFDEFIKSTGASNSYFKPKTPKVESSEAIEPKEKATKPKKGEKKENSKKENSKKSGSLKEGKGKSGGLKSKLPKEPPVPESSTGVFDENGLPTFIIIDVEYQKCFEPPRDLNDLSDELSLILGEDTSNLPKYIKSTHVTRELYLDTITSVISDVKYHYLDYIEEKIKSEIDEKDFLTYLQHKGAYQTYLSSVTRAATAYISSNFNYNPEFSSSEYQAFISNIYMDLIEKMNAVIYKLFNTTIEHGLSVFKVEKNLVDYAYEALELNAYELSNRYFLQNIIDDGSNPDNWFNYAIYHMHLGEHERAVECVLEALKINKYHHNALLMYAVMLMKKKKHSEAETCLLNVVLENTTWVEGWGALYCIYQLSNNIDGSDVALEMASKYLETSKAEEIKDLSWSQMYVPKSVFYRTACFFISLRLYDEAELMISAEIFRKNESIAEYLLAVIAYYKRDFDHALNHIDNAISMGGSDKTKDIFRGHILLAKDDPKCALEEYAKVSYQFTQPDEKTKYFLLIQEGLCYSRLGEAQKAKINFLNACKIGGSPYTWLCTGVLFYHQLDYLSAEQCLTQANSLDTWMPEIWAYLCLVNIKLKNPHEADICCQQMIKNKLLNPGLQALVMTALDCFNKEYNSEKL